MTSLLMFERSWQRIQPSLGSLPPHELLLFTEDRSVRDLDGSTVSPESVSPHVAWLNTEIWSSEQFATFATILTRAPALEWVQSAAAGADFPIIQSLLAKGVRVSSSHVQASSIAESVVGRILSRFQRENERALNQAAHRWQALPFREVLDSRWLIVGFGAIGQAVASRARSFGASIVGVRRSAGADALAERIVPPAALADELPQADVVVLCLPSESNTHLFDHAMLARMKEGAILVNVARGAIVDTAALLAALDGGKLDHAVLDVFETEPLPEDSPLWSHPGITLSAHTSALGLGLAQRGDDLFLENLDLFLRGKPLKWEIGQLARKAADEAR